MADRNFFHILPKELLTHILSYLPTMDAAKTEILASQWKHIWDTVSVLYFNFADFWSEDTFNSTQKFVKISERSERHENFVRVIDAALASRQQIQWKPIDRFTLVWENQAKPYNHQEHPVRRWVGQVLEWSPKVLSVYVQPNFSLIKVPNKTFNCPTLEEMKLQVDSIWPQVLEAESVHLPCLWKLNLGYYTINADFMKKLMTGCPNLEKLELYACRLKLSYASFYSLKNLVINGCCTSMDIRVSIPNLQHLKISMMSCQTAEIVFEHMPHLVKACVCFLTAGALERSFYKRKANILNGLLGVTNLEVLLHGSEAKGMLKHSLKDSPQFKSLKAVHFEGFDVRLLDCVDMIEQLVVHSGNFRHLSFYQGEDGADKSDIKDQLSLISDEFKFFKNLEVLECKQARIFQGLDKLREEINVYRKRFTKMEAEASKEKEKALVEEGYEM